MGRVGEPDEVASAIAFRGRTSNGEPAACDRATTPDRRHNRPDLVSSLSKIKAFRAAPPVAASRIFGCVRCEYVVHSTMLYRMRTAIIVVLVASVATLSFVLLTPAPAGACSPCLEIQSGEKWHLEVDTWTVEDVPQPVQSTAGGFYVSNPVRRDWSLYGVAPDQFLEASLVDPATSGGVQKLKVVRQ
jgi:hypothetical protein